jgi:hypothetical protein
MRHALGFGFVLAALAVLVASAPACHVEYTAPDQPDLYKPRRGFDFDFSGLVIDDLSANQPGDMAHADLRMVDGEQM